METFSPRSPGEGGAEPLPVELAIGPAASGDAASHLILIVHGIGWNGMTRADAIDFVTNNIVKTYQQVLASKVVTTTGRVEFDLIEWHEHLHFTHGLDRMIERVSLPSTIGVRQTIRDTMIDGMAYGFAYGDAMRKAVIELINYRYRAFMKKNPSFDGKVHILGHSLGSVILFDILSSVELRAQLKVADRLVNCFCIGSPLSSFQLLRTCEREEMEAKHHAAIASMEDAGIHYFNIFMQHDAVAYRVEPLLKESYSEKDPVRILDWNHRILLEDPNAAGPRGLNNHLDPATGKPFTVMLSSGEGDERLETPISHKRLDWCIKGGGGIAAGAAGAVGDYMAAVNAHSAYWTSKELMRFMLDNLSGFRTVPGRMVQQSGKGSILSTLGLFTWSFFTFKTRLKQKVEIEGNAGWRGTLAATVAPGGEVAVRGTVYVATQSLIPTMGTIWRVDPSKLVGSTERAVAGTDIGAKGYKTVISEGQWGATKALAMIHDKLYIFDPASM